MPLIPWASSSCADGAAPGCFLGSGEGDAWAAARGRAGLSEQEAEPVDECAYEDDFHAISEAVSEDTPTVLRQPSTLNPKT
jgi:hypothetical protein